MMRTALTEFTYWEAAMRLLLTLFTLSFFCSIEDAVKNDLDGIQGAWKLAALEADGEQGPAEVVVILKLVFKDSTLTFTPGEPGFSRYHFKLDQTTEPAGFDMTHADGENKGKTLKGIYALEGDHLKICFATADKRPTVLTAKARSGQMMYTLVREKP